MYQKIKREKKLIQKKSVGNNIDNYTNEQHQET